MQQDEANDTKTNSFKTRLRKVYHEAGISAH